MQHPYTINTHTDSMDIGLIHQFLSQHSHWAKGIPLAVVEKSVKHSLNFGVFYNGAQVGYARVVTDCATIAYLGDVFVLPKHRGRGLAIMLMDAVMAHPRLQGLRRWLLLTSDAHGLYQKYGWRNVAKPETYMELHNPEVYKNSR